MSNTSRREVILDDLYRKTADLAARYHYSFRRPRVTVGGAPVYLLLGNHSSGKSTLINSILGGDKVQDVGVAPTDDGFTFIVYGEEERDVVGAAALEIMPAEYKDVEAFGASFLQHLRVRVRNRPELKRLILLDSPGMIDTSDSNRDRDYDFMGVVRRFAELADMIFFLFDPEKPGTTGETVRIFSNCLSDVQYKLCVILNKCDLFASVYDFARAYGTLCWNLSRVLRTKDLPKILTIYSGEKSAQANEVFLREASIEEHRKELEQILHNAENRRGDNLFSQMMDDFLGLSVRMGVVNAAMRYLLSSKAVYVVLSLGVTALASWKAWYWGFVPLIASTLLYVPVMMLVRFALSLKTDAIFERVFSGRLAAKTHDNILNAWAADREATAALVKSAPLKLPFFAELKRRRLERRLDQFINSGV